MTGLSWPTTLRPSARPVAAPVSWDRYKAPGNDGRAACELRERVLWQSVLGLRRPPELVDLAGLARAVRAG